MILRKAIFTNYRGICGSREVVFNHMNCIIGQNDVGKSTILKALDAFFNDTNLSKSDYNVSAEDNSISFELYFDCQKKGIFLGEEIETTLEAEELVNSDSLLVIKKVWAVGEISVSKPRTSIFRKKYDANSDFATKTETQLMALCKTHKIDTSKGNGEEFNNVEKRQKLRDFYLQNNIAFSFEFEEVPSTGTTKAKVIDDSIKKFLPAFQYFKADTSLSETDNTIQKYFKELAFKLIQSEIDTEEIESTIKAQLGGVLEKITTKINDVVKNKENVEPLIEFDWSKLISTSFVSTATGNAIPLSSRGDGFRRITMMAYFEYLAENHRSSENHPIIFGFEEPETFLHPSAQDSLFNKLTQLTENGYQVVVSTHSPVIVGNADRKNIIYISKPDNAYTVTQVNLNYKDIAIDLGIKPDNTFTPLFSTSRLLLMVEGIDDVVALSYIADLYKTNGLIEETFEDLNINIIPIGGCHAVKHWVNLELFTKMGKPFFIYLDSDKSSEDDISLNERELMGFNFVKGQDFEVTKKRALENYIYPSALERLVPGAIITYTDFDHAKNYCKDYPDTAIRARLGGAGVASRHFIHQTFDELRLSLFNDGEDEFLQIYNMIFAKLN